MTQYKPGDKVLVVEISEHFFDLGDVVTLVRRDPKCDHGGSLAWECEGLSYNQVLLEKEFKLM